MSIKSYTINEMRELLKKDLFKWYKIRIYPDKGILKNNCFIIPKKYYCKSIVRLIYNRYKCFVYNVKENIMCENNTDIYLNKLFPVNKLLNSLKIDKSE